MGAAHAAAFLEAAEKDVLAYGHGVDEVEFLIDDAQPAAQRVDGRRLLDGLAVENDGAGVLFVNAREYLHQRGFAGAVLAHDAVDDAARHL